MDDGHDDQLETGAFERDAFLRGLRTTQCEEDLVYSPTAATKAMMIAANAALYDAGENDPRIEITFCSFADGDGRVSGVIDKAMNAKRAGTKSDLEIGRMMRGDQAMSAVADGDLEMLKLLLAKGLVDLTFTTWHGCASANEFAQGTKNHIDINCLAASSCHRPKRSTARDLIVFELIQAGCDPAAAFLSAAVEQDGPMARVLLGMVEPVKKRARLVQRAAVRFGKYNGHYSDDAIPLLTTLFELGVSVHRFDRALATEDDDAGGLVRFLLGAGANPLADIDGEGTTAFSYAHDYHIDSDMEPFVVALDTHAKVDAFLHHVPISQVVARGVNTLRSNDSTGVGARILWGAVAKLVRVRGIVAFAQKLAIESKYKPGGTGAIAARASFEDLASGHC